MTTVERMAIIQKRLEEKFSPQYLEVVDDSHLHVGHAGSQDGAGHYTVNIAAHGFQGKNRISVHREIYAELQDLIPHEVHALQIKILKTADV